MRTEILRRFLPVILLLLLPGRSLGAESPAGLSIQLEVDSLPPSAKFVPVSVPLDFRALARSANSTGAVDLHSLRLYQLAGESEQEVPFQFLPDAQPRSQRRTLLPGTGAGVSYVSEYRPGEVPADTKVSGTLHWIAAPSARYLLKTALPSSGSMVQVPYAPHDLHAFDQQGKASRPRWYPEMQIRPLWPLQGYIELFQGESTITRYMLGPSAQFANAPIRRPFFYPVHGPDGLPLTELGKPHDPTGSHAHHYSLWIAHHDVNGQSFWSESGGIIAHEQLVETIDGPLFCRFTQNTRWTNQGQDLLRERRTVTLFKEFADFRIIELELEFTPAGAGPVTFGKTSFGFLAARVRQSMTVFDGGGEIRNSEGQLNEQNVHLQRAKWIDQSGPVSPDRWGGIAIFDSPDNPHHPTTWHCRNDGWAGAAFNAQAAYTLEPGHNLRLKYRVHLHKHDALQGQVAERYAEFAARPNVTTR